MITKDKKIFIFIARPAQININGEGVYLIIADNPEAAKINIADMVIQKTFPPFHYRCVGSFPIDKFQIDDSLKEETKNIEVEKVAAPDSKENFISGLKLVADKFLDEKDKKEFNRLINKIK